MTYKEIVNKKWILPKKDKYTKRDVDNVVLNSLFGAYHIGTTLSIKEAVRIVKCSAVYHDTDWSKTVSSMAKN